ncbi:AGE family epimerase/isomerase [filamentous cyanobacterium LEGE 11480]|uniref:AGE family epimerase/isomerase n=1 Tax=Romeriopsis navalis LEGE 11480 TaxID=2777977 RepID=A0A928VR87_9CYAN|nr:AGE family epimerase/isomerase [Romeriopsis navalis]MBE9030674.1 AGE family epimerase/isomerase [Romeriopsis navalis LEGE 11480]
MQSRVFRSASVPAGFLLILRCGAIAAVGLTTMSARAIAATLELGSNAPVAETTAAIFQTRATVELNPATPIAQALPANLPSRGRWISHAKRDLIPFYTKPGAFGNPIGKFPSVRCNDGSAVNYSNPCPEVAGNGYLLENRHYVVTMSRQVYTYGVAFHLTGNPEYLKYAKAGVDYLRNNAFDRQNGGTHGYFDNRSQAWGPATGLRNPQELSYALLGMSFYYYLTRDAAVLANIKAAKNHIFGRYYNSSLQALQWQLQDGNGDRARDKRFQAQVDQLSYLFLVTPDLPEPLQTSWKRDIERVVNAMLRDFYAPQDNLFFLNANAPRDRDINQVGTDFGHTAKGFWTIRLAGRLLNQQNWIDFADRNGPKLLQRAYLPQEGAWAVGVNAGGSIDRSKRWWIHAELDQLGSVLALQDPAQAQYLPQTYRYWLNRFVDKNQGEVWTNIAAGSNQPIGLPKAWAWKNGYHSMEHALFGYITTSQLQQKNIRLFYAFEQRPNNNSIRPHLFTGQVRHVKVTNNPNGSKVYRVVFGNLGF